MQDFIAQRNVVTSSELRRSDSPVRLIRRSDSPVRLNGEWLVPLARPLHLFSRVINRTLIIVAFAAMAAGCRVESRARAFKPKTNTEMQTIDSANVRPAATDAPPILTDEVPPAKTATNIARADAPPPPT